MTENFTLAGKIVLITGGGSGIGLSLSRQALDAGARVLIADLKLTELGKELVNGNENVIFQKCDVTKWEDFDALFITCEREWGDVPDAYGICAGIFEPPFSNFWQDPEDERYLQVDVNVSHPLKLTRLAIRHSLRKNKKSSLCIIASIGGITGNIAAPCYCATKHAIVGFVKSMKDSESFTGVKITTICPGLVNTPLLTKDKSEQFSVSEERALSPDDVAATMIQLIQKKEYGCGTVLEISKGGLRVIPEWNVPAPVGNGTGQEVVSKDAIDTLLRPILAKLETERNS